MRPTIHTQRRGTYNVQRQLRGSDWRVIFSLRNLINFTLALNASIHACRAQAHHSLYNHTSTTGFHTQTHSRQNDSDTSSNLQRTSTLAPLRFYPFHTKGITTVSTLPPLHNTPSFRFRDEPHPHSERLRRFSHLEGKAAHERVTPRSVQPVQVFRRPLGTHQPGE